MAGSILRRRGTVLMLLRRVLRHVLKGCAGYVQANHNVSKCDIFYLLFKSVLVIKVQFSNFV